MQLDPAEARDATLVLEDAQRKLFIYENRYAGNITLVWGVAYGIAPLTMVLWPKSDFSVGIWVIVLAVIATLALGMRFPIQGASGWKFGALWGLAGMFAAAWFLILLPFSQPGGLVLTVTPMQLWAYGVSLAMFLYVIMGLFCWPRLYLWLGLSVTTCTLVGLFALRDYFWIWTAVTGGGTLLAGGFLVRARSQQFAA